MANFTTGRVLRYLPLHKRYRSHFEIIALMLEAVNDGGASRFSIMKRARINCTQLKRYLESLTEMGFVEMHMKDGRNLYRASERGLGFLRQYYVLLGMLLGAARNAPANIIYEAEHNGFNGQQHSITRLPRRL